MIKINYIADLIQLANESETTISEVVMEFEAERCQLSREQVWATMEHSFITMTESAHSGIQSREKSASGLVGGDGFILDKYLLTPEESLLGPSALKAAAYAMAVNEVNASMGRIVACPTAGSCGILPATLLAVMERYSYPKEKIIKVLFTAAGIGIVIARNASIAGAKGGCQAECGSAAAMAAGALVELRGGTTEQVANGVALAIKNLLGLVCDPVAGLVEVPCVKRNGFSAVHAMLAADMALAGIKSVIPVDEVIDAMDKIGKLIPASLRETSEAGLADTPTARRLEKEILGI